MDTIDKFLIINLKHRTDRLSEILEQFKNVKIPEEKIFVMEAVYEPTFGAYGATQSHIKALQYFEDNKNLNNICIFEDDFNFKVTKEELDEKLTIFFSNFEDWDIVNISHNTNKSNSTHIPIINKPIVMGTASGYCVNRKACSILKNNFQESCDKLKTEGLKHENCLDVHWYKLFNILNWYVFTPSLGYQRKSFSDINKKIENYGC